MTNAAYCNENCRLANPSSLIGDYEKGKYYSDLRLVNLYGGLFTQQDVDSSSIISMAYIEDYDEFFNVMSSVAVNGTATAYSKSIETRQVCFISLLIQATSATGTPSIEVRWEVGKERPATESAASSDYVYGNDDTEALSTISDENWHNFGIFSVPASCGRIRILGLSGNPSDTVVSAKVFLQASDETPGPV